jgi:hypothetical protein
MGKPMLFTALALLEEKLSIELFTISAAVKAV